MLKSTYTIGDLIRHMDSDKVKKVFSKSQIAFIKDGLDKWNFKDKPKSA